MSARRFSWSAKPAELDRVAFAKSRAQRAFDRWPARGAQRIGQLLGDAPGQGSRTDVTSPHAEKFIGRDGDRSDFRVLARALNGAVDPTAEAGR